MAKRLFLLDGMGMIYRAHFALINRPIFTSKGINTSALYGFTQSLLEILREQKPTHIAVAMDSGTPTHRVADFKDYKAERQEMPEDIRLAIPNVYRMLEAFNIPTLVCKGYEADDIVGTLVKKAEREGFQTWMVTLDKDFGQLVSPNTFLYKLSRMGGDVEILGVPEILKKWEVQNPEQVVDVIALWGDTSDNIPGVPGIGEKTAKKLIGQYGSVENLLAHAADLKGKVKDTLETNREQALMSKRLATLVCDAPCDVDLDTLTLQKWDEEKLKAIFTEFEFNSIGRRLFGESFHAGPVRNYQQSSFALEMPTKPEERKAGDSLTTAHVKHEAEALPQAPATLSNLSCVTHKYQLVTEPAERKELVKTLLQQKTFAFDLQTSTTNAQQASLVGIAFCFKAGEGYYLPAPKDEAGKWLEEFRPLLESEQIEKVGHNLKFDLSVMKWHGVTVRGNFFDTMIAHALIEPDLRHTIGSVAEVYLGYSPIPIARLIGEKDPISPADVTPENMTEFAAEQADVAWQLRSKLETLLGQRSQRRVFYEIEAPLLPVLVDMEYEGINVDAAALAEFGTALTKEIAQLERSLCQMAGREFNVNSPRQLGEVLFEVMKICEKPKKTKTGQYATDEQTLLALASDHEIVQRLLEYRSLTKLKSTYADALPPAINPKTGRIHTTYNQVLTATGRLSSQDPNLQNLPIRRERGQEIRKAFVPRKGCLLLSADYSQIELRIIAALSNEPGLIEAFKNGTDVHTATAAKVFNVPLDQVTSEMRRKAKMVNYGIAYGISAFGLSQRLNIPRKEAATIIEQYFLQFPGIKNYMNKTIAEARDQGYVETITGRRRYIRDIKSANMATRSGAERNAINAPIQGSAADMIKLAMIHIHREITQHHLKSRMLLQVHDELVFDVVKPEEKQLRTIVEEKMKKAIELTVPIEVEMGVGENWLEAH